MVVELGVQRVEPTARPMVGDLDEKRAGRMAGLWAAQRADETGVRLAGKLERCLAVKSAGVMAGLSAGKKVEWMVDLMVVNSVDCWAARMDP